MQYILDQAEYDEYMELKDKSEPLSKPDWLIELLISNKTKIDVIQLLHGYKEQYEVMIKVNLEDLPNEAKALVMSRARRY